jgi:hydroxymethylglutaryl-CoA lyase
LQQIMEPIQLVECPRDAMQGWKTIIPAMEKINYLNALLKVGFHTLDFGSFVSPKLIPQMADTAAVLSGLDMGSTRTRLLAIIANTRGAEEASRYNSIRYLGFPFSISPTFQQRNTNSSPEESLFRVREIASICSQTGKELVVYMSMGFGNPYGDPYNPEILYNWMKKVADEGVKIISIADTVGLAGPDQIQQLLSAIIPLFPGITIGVHLHSNTENQENKMDAAFNAGCRRFDGAINGIGGCPMANDELVGNMDTIKMVRYLQKKGFGGDLDMKALEECRNLATGIFN